jgi:hypothetical protein
VCSFPSSLGKEIHKFFISREELVRTSSCSWGGVKLKKGEKPQFKNHKLFIGGTNLYLT